MKAVSPSPELIRKNSKLSIRRQCELLGVNRSSLYYKPSMPDDEQIRWKEYVMARIDYWHTQMPYLGSRRLSKKLREEGIDAGRKLVRKLMEEMGIQAICPKPNLSRRNFREGITPYLLRGKKISFPNQAWSIDITYIKMNNSHMYLTAIIDWYSRMIVGWNLSDTLDSIYTIQAVKDAISNYGVPAIINSDQGSQFTSSEYKQFLSDMHIQQSMDGKSRWADNIMIERWFRSLKTEEIYINEYSSPKQLRGRIARYIKQYNNERPHSAIGNRAPASVYNDAFSMAA